MWMKTAESDRQGKLDIAMKSLLNLLSVLHLLSVLCASNLYAVDDVSGTLFTLTNTPTVPNGAWSWFEDERAIVDATDPANPLLLVSSVSAAPDGDVESGDIDLLWRNLNTGVQGKFELHDRLERDDHNSAALYLRPDGRYLAMYSRHGSDNFTRWRVSTNPHDPTSWGAMQTLNNGVGATYNNIYYLPNDNNGAGRTYNFTRAMGYDPVVQTSTDDGTAWSNVGQLLTQGDGGDRPYVKYASDGKRIHFISTEEHPRDFANGIYHGYIQDGVLYDSLDSIIDNNLFDSNAVSPTALTRIFANGSSFNGTTMNRAWTISLEMDNTGNPAGIFTARANDNSNDHRFFYARFDGADWQVNEMAKAGGFLYAAENDYTGLASIDPDNPNVVFMSTKIDPRSDALTSRYELYRGETADFGATWSWSAITENSTVDNLRPLVPAWNGQDTALVWMRGTYATYTNWNTEVVGLKLTDSGPKSLLWKGNADISGLWDDGISSNWNSGGTFDSFHQGDEVAFDDSADTYQVHLQGPMTPMSIAFNNTVMPYTLTGAGIRGSGGIRVIGGGIVTLHNAPNTYTGETLIAKGTLVLSGIASLSDTAHIKVKSQGTLDISGLDSHSLTLNAQNLTVEGKLVGDIHAFSATTVNLISSAELNGQLTLDNSTLTGDGTITGNLTATSGTQVRVGTEGISVQSSRGPALYVDATSGASGNTTLANGAIFNPPLDGTTGADNAWEQRTALGSHGNIFESGGEAVENASQLRTTLTGLTTGQAYEVSVLFWDANGDVEDWNIRAGFEPAGLTFFANGTTSDAAQLGAVGADLASSLTYTAAPTLFNEANRILLAGVIGQVVVGSNGQLHVYIDDMPSAIGANNRTWYDGIVLKEVSFPTSQLVTLEVGGDYVQHSQASLRLDIYSPGILDKLDVAGHFAADGTLVVSLVDGAPAPQLGDRFDILKFGSLSGNFAEYDLPVLEPGLAWNVTSLLTIGELEVVRNVDFNSDGDVDGRDFLAIQRIDPSLIFDWQKLYGGRLVTPMTTLSLVVPEPAVYSLVCLASTTSAMMRLRAITSVADKASEIFARRSISKANAIHVDNKDKF